MQIQNTTANENLDSWQEKKYAEFYAEEYTFLKRRVAQGAVNADAISASISAYEAILEELKSNTQETHL